MAQFKLVDANGNEVIPANLREKPSSSADATAKVRDRVYEEASPQAELATAIKHLERGQARAALRAIVDAANCICEDFDLPFMTLRDFVTS